MVDPFALFDLDSVVEGEWLAASLQVATRHPHEERIVANASNRVAWLRARAHGVTATDAAKLSSRDAVRQVAHEKFNIRPTFSGSRYTEHGRSREPVIARWVRRNHGITPSSSLFHAAGEPRHLATPDGLSVTESGQLELCEIKTTTRAWKGIPRSYLRQVWWQQYVLGAERTLVVWEQHSDFYPVAREPQCRWVDRDDDQIAILVDLASDLLELITRPQRTAIDGSAARAFYQPGALAVHI